jgi:ABC-type branched-subunit amino acid transport system substrate-binding protein
MNNRKILALIHICILLLAGGNVRAEENTDLTFGMSAAFSGPAKELGINMRKGIEAYFKRINAGGGIKGRNLRLISVDDGYEPEHAASNVYKLINREGVTAFIGNVGTPTAKTAMPISVEYGVLYFAPFTGSSILRPYQNRDFLIRNRNNSQYLISKYVINYRASYAQETEQIIENLLGSGIKPYEIAIFTQDDDYGLDGYRGAVDALEKRGYSHSAGIPYGTYQRNTLNVENGLLEILNSRRQIRAVIVVGSYKPAAKFIRFAQKLIPNAVFMNVSFVGCTNLAESLEGVEAEVYVTQVLPHYNSDLELVDEYNEDLRKYFPGTAPGFVSLEGYIAAYIFVQGLKNAKGDYSSDGIIAGIEGLDFSKLGLGIDQPLGEFDHQISDKVWLTKIDKGSCEEVSWKEFRQAVQKSSGGRNNLTR